MGTLADTLNKPAVFEIGGKPYKVRRLSIGEIFDQVQEGFVRAKVDISKKSLHEYTQEAVDTGNFPRQAVELLVFAAMSDINDGFDMEDAKALCTPDNMATGVDVAAYSVGTDAAPKKKQPTKTAKKKPAEEQGA